MSYLGTISSLPRFVTLACSALGTEVTNLSARDIAKIRQVHEAFEASSSNKGTFLNILKKQPNGEWKISHHMWDDPVGQQR